MTEYFPEDRIKLPVSASEQEASAGHTEDAQSGVLLVQQAKNGDRTAFAELYKERVQRVGSYVRSLIGNTADLEDVVADVFIRAWRRMAALRNPARFDSWLFSIAHNEAVGHIRKSRTKNVTNDFKAEADLAVSEERPEDAAIQRQLSKELMEAIIKLNSQQRNVIALRFLYGMSHGEIGTQIGKRPEAVRALQYRALAKIKTHLESTVV